MNGAYSKLNYRCIATAHRHRFSLAADSSAGALSSRSQHKPIIVRERERERGELVTDDLVSFGNLIRSVCASLARRRLSDSVVNNAVLSVAWAPPGGKGGEASPYGWTSKNYVICVSFHCHGTSSYHTTNTLQGRRAKSHVDTQTIQPGLGDIVLSTPYRPIPHFPPVTKSWRRHCL